MILIESRAIRKLETYSCPEVVDRIRKNAGVPWQPQSLDTFKAGDPATPVMGIATAWIATMDLLTRASKDKTNLTAAVADPVRSNVVPR
jgi:hypothetical protein